MLAKIIAEHKHVPDEDKDSVYRAAFVSQLTAGWEFVGAPKADQRLILAKRSTTLSPTPTAAIYLGSCHQGVAR